VGGILVDARAGNGIEQYYVCAIHEMSIAKPSKNNDNVLDNRTLTWR
jgi:hypothetical protein